MGTFDYLFIFLSELELYDECSKNILKLYLVHMVHIYIHHCYFISNIYHAVSVMYVSRLVSLQKDMSILHLTAYNLHVECQILYMDFLFFISTCIQKGLVCISCYLNCMWQAGKPSCW
jgi:hypothetical protein